MSGDYETSPIPPGEKFSLSQELKDIRSMPDKREALTLLRSSKDSLRAKEKYQQEGLTLLEISLEHIIRDNPAISADELKTHAQSIADTYGFPEDYRSKIVEGINRYIDKHAVIEKFSHDTTGMSDEEKFMYLFKMSPTGPVEVRINPTTVSIIVDNGHDYTTMFKKEVATLGSEVPGSLVEAIASGSKGMTFQNGTLPGLEHSVIGINKEAIRAELARKLKTEPSSVPLETVDMDILHTERHEEEHSIYHLIVGDDKPSEDPAETMVNNLVDIDMTYFPEQHRPLIQKELRIRRQEYETTTQAEILSMYAGNLDFSRMGYLFFSSYHEGGVYDYSKRSRRGIIAGATFIFGEEKRSEIEADVQKIFVEEMLELIHKAIDAIKVADEKIKKSGKYTNEEDIKRAVISRFRRSNLQNWPTIAAKEF